MLLIALPIAILYGIIVALMMKKKGHIGVAKLAGIAGSALGYIVGAIIDLHFLPEETHEFTVGTDPMAAIEEMRAFRAERGEEWAKIIGVAIGAITGCWLGYRYGSSTVLVCSSFLGSLMVVKGLSTFFWTEHWPTFSKALNAEFASDRTEFWVFAGLFFACWLLGLTIQCCKCPHNKAFHEEGADL